MTGLEMPAITLLLTNKSFVPIRDQLLELVGLRGAAERRRIKSDVKSLELISQLAHDTDEALSLAKKHLHVRAARRLESKTLRQQENVEATVQRALPQLASNS